MTRLLHFGAIAMTIAGLVDPAITMSGAIRPRLAIVVSIAEPHAVGRSPAASAPSAPRPAPEARQIRRERMRERLALRGEALAVRVRDRLARSLGAAYQIVPQIASDSAGAIVIGDRYPDDPVPEGLAVATVTTGGETGPNVRLVRVETPSEVPAATMIHVEVEVDGVAVAGRTTDVSVRIAGLEIGRASHRWSADRERWRAGLDVVPLGEPPFVFRIEARPVDGETTTLDNAADASVDVRRHAFRVQVYEPRPSWATTFVRRALEADARFQVESVSFSSRGIAARTRDDVPLNDPRLGTFDVLIAGGLDRLSAADVRSLDRYMRERRGAVVLLPDQRIDTGAVRDLLPAASLTERLLERPVKLETPKGVASLEVSELLVSGNLTPGVDLVLGTAGRDPSPVIVLMPHGGGRLLLSGAMDAWRFRAANGGAFDRFWQATVAGLALAAPPPIDVSVVPPLLRPGERGEVIVRLREPAAVGASIDGDPAIRLRPQPEAGVFRGTFTAKETPGRSTVDVHVAGTPGPSASRTLLVQADVRRVTPDATPALSMLASSHRGIDVTPDRIADVERFVRGTVASPRGTIVRHPMRSAWWSLPFAVCLSAEWWIRRRRGLR